VGMEGDVVTMQDLFKFEQTGLDERHRPIGAFRSSGLRPTFSNRLDALGFHMDAKWFIN
jgi:pilus assembly protein CpaF